MNENITPRQQKAIEALLLRSDVSQACKAAGISRPTMYRWMKHDRGFQNALKLAEDEALKIVVRSLVGLSTEAVETLRSAMTDPQSPPAARIRAADIILARLLQLRELVTLEERVRILENVQGIERN